MLGRAVRAAGAVALAGALSGCWVQVGFDAGHSRFNDLEKSLTADNADTLTEDWSVDAGVSASEPIVNGSRVYLATGGVQPNGMLEAGAAAYAVSSGDTIWNRTFASYCCVVPGDIRTASAVPVAFVGDELWSGYTVIAANFDGVPKFFDNAAPLRLDPDDGATIAGESNFFGLPTIDAGDRVVVSSVDGGGTVTIDVRDETGTTTLWTAQPPGAGFGGQAAVVDGQVLAVHWDHLSAYPLAGCGAATCSPTWTLDLGGTPGPLAARKGGASAFMAVGNDLVAIDRATGVVSWRATLGAPSSGAAVTGDTVYVAAGPTLFAFPAGGCGGATCAPTWSTSLAGAATTAPVVAGGVVYVGGAGSVQAYDVSACAGTSCPTLADLTVAGTPAHLSVAAGRLFVVEQDGTLTAFTPGDLRTTISS